MMRDIFTTRGRTNGMSKENRPNKKNVIERGRKDHTAHTKKANKQDNTPIDKEMLSQSKGRNFASCLLSQYHVCFSFSLAVPYCLFEFLRSLDTLRSLCEATGL